MKIFFLLILYCLLLPSISFSQDNEDEEEMPDLTWQVSDIKFSFKKTKSFKDEELSNIIAATPGSDLNINTIINDVITLKKFYFDNGFFNAIIDTVLNYNYNDREVVIVYTIIENERSRINSLVYSGLDSIPGSLNDSIFGRTAQISPGEFYSRAKINLEIARILNILQNNGYAYAKKQEVKVANIFSTNPNIANKVDIEMFFNTGNLYYFGNTNVKISKNKYDITQSYIKRNLEYKEGDIYSRRKIESSQRKILSNAIVESAAFNIDSNSSGDNLDINVNISIRNKYEVTPEILGYQIDNRFYGGLGVSFYDRFFLSGSRVFNVSLRALANSVAYNRLENTAQVSESYLFGNPNLAGNLRFDLNFLNLDTINAIEVSGKASVTYDLPTFTYINRLLFSSEVTDQNVTVELPSLNNAKGKQRTLISTLSASALHLGVDDQVFPTRGLNQTFTAQEGGLIGRLFESLFDVNVYKFAKFTVSNDLFFNFSSNPQSTSVLGTKLDLGILIETGDNPEELIVDSTSSELSVTIFQAPIDLLFTAGGSTNNRGWRANTLGFVPNQEQGGKFSIDGSIEHRLRPFINSDNQLIKDLGFVYFLDYGNVWENVSDFKINQIAMSTGFGIRYYTIIGAVRLDLGLKLYDPNPGPVGVTKWIFQSGANLNDKYNIQFGLGNTF